MLAPVMPPADRRLAPFGRLRLSAEIIATYARVRWRLSRADLSTTLAELRDRQNGAAQSALPDPRVLARLGRAAERTLRLLPTDSRCMMQSLVLSGLLSRRGIESKLILAVRPGEDFAAHAWVESQGKPLLKPGGPHFGRLVEI